MSCFVEECWRGEVGVYEGESESSGLHRMCGLPVVGGGLRLRQRLRVEVVVEVVCVIFDVK